jgi:hypothetical protein
VALTFGYKHAWMGARPGVAAAVVWGILSVTLTSGTTRTDETEMTPPVNFDAPRPSDAFDARRLFRRTAPPCLVDQFRHSASQAACAAYVTLWMPLYQRLHGGACLDDAVSAFLFNFPKEDLPGCKRAKGGSLSADTGACSEARDRPHLETAVWLADHVFESRRVDLLDGTSGNCPTGRADKTRAN